MQTLARLLCLAALCVAATACSKVTVENYDKIRVGMTYEEVKQLLGAPNHCSDVMTVKSCTWGDEKRHVQVSFVADQVVLFSSENLR
ncbi:outer membrane protein assembly factor BamE domain-containing protein [Aromatoleum buckelii]|uniref:Lipoprotein SmpA/OmlA domain-containing protein n=1 Tax=Aromatoleum buckelii TaxID=200254 RepID=A0ABX1N5S0_9RHOO|nr:outer membrane protein assembly factor BamE [Aromatoleum buckelii]MCK0510975.1 outer membrane protein assembly factor BamE [Aromatoleum buckelii]